MAVLMSAMWLPPSPHMVTANLRMGKLLSLVFCFCVFAFTCSFFRARRILRVFLGLKSVGNYFFPFLPLHNLRASAFCFWLYTVRIRAMALRTILILASFEA